MSKASIIRFELPFLNDAPAEINVAEKRPRGLMPFGQGILRGSNLRQYDGVGAEIGLRRLSAIT